MLPLALTGSESLGRHYIAMFEAAQNVTLKPTETWREALLDTRVMDLFFTVSTSLPHPLHRLHYNLCRCPTESFARTSLMQVNDKVSRLKFDAGCADIALSLNGLR